MIAPSLNDYFPHCSVFPHTIQSNSVEKIILTGYCLVCGCPLEQHSVQGVSDDF